MVTQGYYNWKEDISFGRQRVQGCNPVLIELCQKLPEKYEHVMLITWIIWFLYKDSNYFNKRSCIIQYLHSFCCQEKWDSRYSFQCFMTLELLLLAVDCKILMWRDCLVCLSVCWFDVLSGQLLSIITWSTYTYGIETTE